MTGQSTDSLGVPITAGAQVRIPKMPPWLLKDLPEDEAEKLKSLTGTVMKVVEIDQFGYVWFGDSSPWFCLRPEEILVET